MKLSEFINMYDDVLEMCQEFADRHNISSFEDEAEIEVTLEDECLTFDCVLKEDK